MIEGEISNHQFSHIDGPPSSEIVYNHLLVVREHHQLTDSLVWRDDRLHTAIQGLNQYVDLYNHSSPITQDFLRKKTIVQCFSGVRPIVGIANEQPNHVTLIPRIKHDAVLLPVVIQEVSNLTEGTDITIKKIDYTHVPYMNRYSFEFMNFLALENIKNENPDLFPQTQDSISSWLLNNPEEWPPTPQGKNESAKIKEIRYGILSGYPRNACEKYAAESTSNLDMKNILLNVVLRRDLPMRNIHFDRIQDTALGLQMDNAGLPFVAYSEEDVAWVSSAGLLLTTLQEQYHLPQLSNSNS